MKVLLISTCKEKLHEREFVDPYTSYLQTRVDVKAVHYTKLTNADVEEADAIIICGTGIADNDYLKRLDRFSWLVDAKKPVMGVCSGSQIIASVFGAKIIPDLQIGMVEMKGNLFGRETFQAYVLHQNGFGVPENFDALARSRTVQAIKHKTRQIYGVAFHPEVRNMWILEKFLCLD